MEPTMIHTPPIRREPGADVVGWWIAAGLVEAIFTTPLTPLTILLIRSTSELNISNLISLITWIGIAVGLSSNIISALLQWRGLHRYLSRLRPLAWIGPVLAGGISGLIVGYGWDILRLQLWPPEPVIDSPVWTLSDSAGPIEAAILSGALIGGLQWRILRPWVQGAGWWLVARIGVGGLAAVSNIIVFVFGTLRGGFGGGDILSLIGIIALVTDLLYVGAAALLGLVMLWLLRRTRATEAAARRDVTPPPPPYPS